jgi:hypothetical protein
MSSTLYQTCLFWDGRRGCARSDGVDVQLTQCPLARPVIEVDYVPAVRLFRIRESAHGWRDMEAAERERCASLLQRVATAAKSALAEQS